MFLLVQDCILVIGGSDGSKKLQSCEMFNTEFVFQVSDLCVARLHAVAATNNNTAYVYGGESNKSALDDAEQYNSIADKWTLLEQYLAVPRYSMASATVGDAVYFIGGWKPNTKLANVESFDFTTNSFTTMQPIPTPRDGSTAVAVRVSNSVFSRLTKSRR